MAFDPIGEELGASRTARRTRSKLNIEIVNRNIHYGFLSFQGFSATVCGTCPVYLYIQRNDLLASSDVLKNNYSSNL